MQVKFGGVRGSYPVAQKSFMAFGGETTSVLVTGDDGRCLLIDAGTGIRRLAPDLAQQQSDRSLLLLMTHYHLDHVIGLATLPQLYDTAWAISIKGPRKQSWKAGDAIPPLLASPYWPFQPGGHPARIDYETIRGQCMDDPIHCGGIEVRWCPLHHCEGSTAYRIDEPATGASFVFATDVEWSESSEEERAAFIELAGHGGAPDLLVFDGQYTPENYDQFRGWGHSTWREAVDVAQAVHAGRLLITHHAPDRDDAELTVVEAAVADALPGAGLAREGTELTPGT